MRRPSPAALIALLALIVALGGTATAAKNTISGSDVRNRSLTGADVKPGSLSGRQIRNGTVGSADLRRNAVRGRHIKRGSVRTSDLAPNQRMTAGQPGLIDLSRLSVIQGATVTVPDDTTQTATATCPAGHKATGGGFNSTRPIASGAFPSSDGTSFSVILSNTRGVTLQASAYAICVAP